MQGGHQKAGAILKTTWSAGRAFWSDRLAVITREQQETRRLLVAGRGACGQGLKDHLILSGAFPEFQDVQSFSSLKLWEGKPDD